MIQNLFVATWFQVCDAALQPAGMELENDIGGE